MIYISISNGNVVDAYLFLETDAPKHTGLTLFKYYNTSKKVKNLLESSNGKLGICAKDIYRLGERMNFDQFWKPDVYTKYMFWEPTQAWYVWLANTSPLNLKAALGF